MSKRRPLPKPDAAYAEAEARVTREFALDAEEAEPDGVEFTGDLNAHIGIPELAKLLGKTGRDRNRNLLRHLKRIETARAVQILFRLRRSPKMTRCCSPKMVRMAFSSAMT